MILRLYQRTGESRKEVVTNTLCSSQRFLNITCDPFKATTNMRLDMKFA